MCLHRKGNKMQVADEDITCYKIIEAVHMPYEITKYKSYFQDTEIVFGTPIEAAFKLDIEELDMPEVLSGEVVHAFVYKTFSSTKVAHLKECTTYCGPFNCKAIDIIVIECTIPKGTYYCRGYDEGLTPCYGALTIIPNKIITKLATVYR